jgi:hypothetical protein
MNLNVPNGIEINKIDNNVIKIKIPNTDFWVLGEQLEDKTWNAFLFDPITSKKESIKKKTSTKSFALFSEIVLKTPFPYSGKNTNSKVVKKFIKNIIKTNKNGNK